MRFCTLCRRAAPAPASHCAHDGCVLTVDQPVEHASQTVGRYQLMEIAAKGETGVVFRAQDTSSGRFVAVKFLDAALSADAAVMQRVLRETKNAIKLANPNVARVLECGDHQGRFFVVREWLEGHPLSVAMKTEGQMHLARAAAIIYQICGALGLVHRVGLTHRDLKPSHIFLAQTNQAWDVKLIDVGLPAPIKELQSKKNIWGAVGYVSPEQAEGKPESFRSDLYSLGVLFFEMLAGRPLYSGSVQEVLAQHLAGTPTDIATLRPDVPAPVGQLLSKLLARQAAARPFSASVVQRDLERVVPACKEPLAPVTPHRPVNVAPAAGPKVGPAAGGGGEDMAMAATLFGTAIDASAVRAAYQQGASAPSPMSPAPVAVPRPPAVGGGPFPVPGAEAGADTLLAETAPAAFVPSPQPSGPGPQKTILGMPAMNPSQAAALRQAAVQPGPASSPPAAVGGSAPAGPGWGALPSAPSTPSAQAPGGWAPGGGEAATPFAYGEAAFPSPASPAVGLPPTGSPGQSPLAPAGWGTTGQELPTRNETQETFHLSLGLKIAIGVGVAVLFVLSMVAVLLVTMFCGGGQPAMPGGADPILDGAVVMSPGERVDPGRLPELPLSQPLTGILS